MKQGTRKSLRKLLALVLTLTMMLSITNLAAFAANDENKGQIVDKGGEEKGDGGVEVSKYIYPTDKENYFDIELTVKTPSTKKELLRDMDVAVVIVMDISNTMNGILKGKTSRYDAVMTAATQFMNKFQNRSENSNASRKVGFVAFNTDAQVIFDLTDCKKEEVKNDLVSQMKDKTESIIHHYQMKDNKYCVDHKRFTNIEGGIKLARNMLDTSGIENKYIIFLSDGFPTTYLKDHDETSVKKLTGYDPYMANSVT